MVDSSPVTLLDGSRHDGWPASARNAHVNWDVFEPHVYNDHNYGRLRDDDRQILEIVRDFFAGCGLRGANGIDVGSGPNLYPALSMLPYCDWIDLREYSAANVEWLRREVKEFGPRWDEFWQALTVQPDYAAVADPRELLRRASVTHESIFHLPERIWDIGTMFFVACSISSDIAEFERAVRCFVQSLVVGAPFAAAFMIDSKGYRVGGHPFPAVALAEADLARAMASIADDVAFYPIETQDPLRVGYGGMMVLTGRSR